MGSNKRYVVVREYSHTDKNCLWKVLTRGMKDRTSAEDWRDFEEENWNKKKRKTTKFFVIEVEEENLL